MATVRYIKNFIRDRNVASITPTSRVSVEKICRKINFDTAEVIVEYGPGGGVFTRHILQNLSPSGRLVAIEKNENFYNHLKRAIHDPRFSLVQDTAENVESVLANLGIQKVDAVISGIPFSFFEDPLRARIVNNTKAVLKPGGKFIIYQFYSPFLRKRFNLNGCLSDNLKVVRIHFEIFNLPPLRVYEAINA